MNAANVAMEIRLRKFDPAIFDTPNFRQRVLSALILIPIVLVCARIGGLAYALAIIIVMELGLREWLRLIDPVLPAHIKFGSFLALLLTLGGGAWANPALGLMIGGLTSIVLFVIAARNSENTAGWITTGIPYMGGSGLAMLYLRNAMPDGFGILCYLFAVVWGTDIGAYFVGRTLGGPKLAPNISPNKTWSGLIGGMALAGLLGFAVAVCADANKPSVGFGLAIFLAGVAQIGDLFKSFFKRRAGVKDSGGIIPGHGGILDRIDGLVFAAIFFVLFQVGLGNAMQWW